MAKQIGIGPTLFLMSTKALSWLFLILTILNLPVMIFYFNGSGGTDSQKGLKDLFVQLSLGNVGESSQACGERNIAQIENDNNYGV